MYGFQTHIFSGAEEMYMPRLAYLNRSPQKSVHEFFIEQSYLFLPTAGYAMEHRREGFTAEDQETVAQILEAQANDENCIDENGNLISKESPETAQNVQPSGETSLSSVDMSIERLRDFDYLLSNFYTVDSSTMIGPEQLNADDLLGRSMKINKKEDGPKVLIFHTHSQEEFVDSIPGDPATSIVGIGEYLTELLNKRGIKQSMTQGYMILLTDSSTGVMHMKTQKRLSDRFWRQTQRSRWQSTFIGMALPRERT